MSTRSTRNIGGFSLGVILIAGADLFCAAPESHALSFASEVAQSGFSDVIGKAGYPNGVPAPLTGESPYDFSGQPYGALTEIDRLSVGLTLWDGDSAWDEVAGRGEDDWNDLYLGLDGIDTGIALNGFRNQYQDTLTVTGVPEPAVAQQILDALGTDGLLVGTIIDRDPYGYFAGILTGNRIQLSSAFPTRLEIYQQDPAPVPEPAAAALLGVMLAGMAVLRARGRGTGASGGS
ncbi:MAG: hypothetical protein HY900_10230 [Deltaproteobacteria bacterium]|nr:hypothetical protein [Deltaproteobacteria bacterium]